MEKERSLQILWQELKRNNLSFEVLLEVMEKYPSLRDAALQEFLILRGIETCSDRRDVNKELMQIFRSVPELREKSLARMGPYPYCGNFPYDLLELAKEFPQEALAIAKQLIKTDSWQGFIHRFFALFPELIEELWPELKNSEPDHHTYIGLVEAVPLLGEEAAEFLLAKHFKNAKYLQQIIIHVPKYREEAWQYLLKSFSFERNKMLVRIVLEAPDFSQPVFSVLQELGDPWRFEKIIMQTKEPLIRKQALELLLQCDQNDSVFSAIFFDHKVSQEVKLDTARALLSIKDMGHDYAVSLLEIINDIPELAAQAWTRYAQHPNLSTSNLAQIMFKRPELRQSIWPMYLQRYTLPYQRSTIACFVEQVPEVSQEAALILLENEPTSHELIAIIKHVPDERDRAWRMLQKFKPNQEDLQKICEEVPEMACGLSQVPVAPKQILAAMAAV